MTRVLPMSCAALIAGASAQPVLAQAGRPPISGAAFAAADSAYRDYAAGRYHAAAEEARRSVRSRPDIPRLRLLLVRALRADGRSGEALIEAEAALRAGVGATEIRREAAEIRAAAAKAATPAPPVRAAAPPAASPARTPAAPGYDDARDAYAALAAGDPARAAALAEAAVRAAPRDRSRRSLLVDSLTAAGRLDEASAAAEAARVLGPDAGMDGRRAFLLLRLDRPLEAEGAFQDALAGRTDDAARRRLALGLADARLRSGRNEAALEALAPYAGERSYDTASRRAQALLALRRGAQALEAVRIARTTAPDGSERARQTLAELHVLDEAGRAAEVRALLREVVADDGFGRGAELDVAELAVRNGDDRDALVFFGLARASGALTGAAALDAAYAAKRQADNHLAADLFRSALRRDAAVEHALPADRRDRIGRELAEVGKTWGVNATVLAGAVNLSSAANGAAPGSDQRIIQAGGEAYWRPPVIGYRDGRTVELFARAFATLEDQSGGPTGGESVQGYLGARWKPLSSENLVLETSRLVKLGAASRDDWLLRAAYSREYGLDLGDPRPNRPTWRVYGELDRFTGATQTLAFAEARAGWLFRLRSAGDRLALSPVLDLAYSFDDRAAREAAFGLGPALAMRYWFPRAGSEAANSYLELTAGERVRVFGARRADGPFASLTLVY